MSAAGSKPQLDDAFFQLQQAQKTARPAQLGCGCAGEYFPGKRSWDVDTKLDVAIPGATQNEIEIEDAKALVKKGVKVVLEGANMPSTSEAIDHFHENGVTFAAAKVHASFARLRHASTCIPCSQGTGTSTSMALHALPWCLLNSQPWHSGHGSLRRAVGLSTCSKLSACCCRILLLPWSLPWLTGVILALGLQGAGEPARCI